MTWFRLDDQGAFHEKVVAAGNEAYGAWCRAGQWCSAHLTDGRLPWTVATSIGSRKLWDKLLAVRLCEKTSPTELHIHDYLKYNPSAELVRAERARKTKNTSSFRNRKRDGGVTGDTTGYIPGFETGDSPAENHGPDPVPEDPNGSSPGAPKPQPNPDVGRVFQHWLAVLAPLKFKRTPDLTPDRAKVISTRLKEFSTAELCQAIDGVRKSPHHCGQNDTGEVYVEFSTIFRNRAKVEDHIARADGPGRPSVDPAAAAARRDNLAQEAALKRAGGGDGHI